MISKDYQDICNLISKQVNT